jgi:phospholipid/cholesterol/gamma-HCH transport system permease protein
MGPFFSTFRALRDIIRIYGRVGSSWTRQGLRVKETMGFIYSMGVGSLPIIVFATAFAGIVVTGEIAFHMDLALHTIEMVPGFSGQFVFREVGIAIPALLLVSKVGASTTAEVGSMKVTEQIDALKLLKIDPVEYLVGPRLLASLVVFPCLTLLAILVTMTCAIVVAVGGYGFSLMEYLNALSKFISAADLVCAVTKALAFGAVIPVVSCYYGFHCRGGAEGVGAATTNSVVTSTLAVIVIDFLLSFAFAPWLG